MSVHWPLEELQFQRRVHTAWKRSDKLKYLLWIDSVQKHFCISIFFFMTCSSYFSLARCFLWIEIPRAQVQVCGGGPARGLLHPLRVVAGLQLWSRPPLEPTRDRAVQHGLRLKDTLQQIARLRSVQKKELTARGCVCVCVLGRCVCITLYSMFTLLWKCLNLVEDGVSFSCSTTSFSLVSS